MLPVRCGLGLALLSVLTVQGRAEEIRITPAVLSVIDESQIAAEESGVITEICVEVGQHVAAGTRLAQLSDQDAQLKLNQARIEYEQAVLAANDVDVRSAQQALSLARLDLQRAREAVDRYAKSVSGAQIDRLEVIVARAELDVERAMRDTKAAALAVDVAENGMRIAERGIARRQIMAPIDGVIVMIDVRPGEWVEPGKPVFRVVNISRLRAEAFFEFDRLAKDIQAQKVTFSTGAPSTRSVDACGVVTFVSPEVNRVNGQVRIWAEIDNARQLLRPGITGTLTVHDTAAADAAPPEPSAPLSDDSAE